MANLAYLTLTNAAVAQLTPSVYCSVVLTQLAVDLGLFVVFAQQGGATTAWYRVIFAMCSIGVLVSAALTLSSEEKLVFDVWRSGLPVPPAEGAATRDSEGSRATSGFGINFWGVAIGGTANWALFFATAGLFVRAAANSFQFFGTGMVYPHGVIGFGNRCYSGQFPTESPR